MSVLIDKMRQKEWMLRDRFERATEANKSAHDASPEKPTYPFSQDTMFAFQLEMLDAQIELEKLAPTDNLSPGEPENGA